MVIMKAYIASNFALPTVLRRALTSLRPAYRRTSAGFGPAAAPGL
jgi:hypothetical protein